jgi:hypothetical protein
MKHYAKCGKTALLVWFKTPIVRFRKVRRDEKAEDTHA